jgi:small conductance mechanosensitive channel
MSDFWQHLIVAVVVIVLALVLAKLVDWRISRHDLAPGSVTRYRVLRRTLFAVIIFVGVMSALLVIPQIRAVAGGVLASSAVIGLVIGFASQRTIGNVVAGILIAISQPLRIGDEVEIQGVQGVVEEIGLTYTWIRTRDNDRLVVPNEKLASDTIRNSTIRSEASLAEVTIQVPAGPGLRRVLDALRVEGEELVVSDLEGDKATVVVRKWIPRERVAEEAASELRIALAERLSACAPAPEPV